MARTRLSKPELEPAQVVSAGPARTLEQIAWLMDRSIRIPGTRITVGLDAVLGLLPIGGDVLTGLVQAGVVLVALYHYRVPKAVAARMVANVAIDTALGAIPFLGDLFDVAFKANTRNLRLLNEVQQKQSQGQAIPAGPSVRYLLMIGGILGALLLLVLVGFIALVAWAIKQPLF
jgi:hypothetical protein